MPSVPRKGKTGVYVEFPDELLARARAFADERGQKFAAVVREALERHLAYPPATGPAPLPDAAATKPAKGRKGKAGR